MSEFDRRVIGDLVSTTVDAVSRRIQIPRVVPGTVSVAGHSIFGVLIDDPSNDSPVFCKNISGVYPKLNDRVMVLFEPPQGAFIVGFASNAVVPRLLGRAKTRASDVGDANWTTSTVGLGEASSALRVQFMGPANGKIRAKVYGGHVSSFTEVTVNMAMVENSTSTLMSGSYSRLAGWGGQSMLAYEQVIEGITPGFIYNWSPWWGVLEGVGGVGVWTTGLYAGYSVCEIWTSEV